jgi:RimJ/RimL family protein N-acetyltransferase
MPMHVYFETERMALRRFTESDVDALVNLDSDPEVMRYLNGGHPTPRDVVERAILPRFMSYYQRSEGYGWWAAIEKGGEFLGWFCLHPDDDHEPDVLALGYRLRRLAWGKGYATEGARALVEKGFAELGARRIFAVTYEHNLGSRRVMEKAGLRLVRTYRMTPEEIAAAGTFVADPGVIWEGSDVEYALEREEWLGGQDVGDAPAVERPV